MNNTKRQNTHKSIWLPQYFIALNILWLYYFTCLYELLDILKSSSDFHSLSLSFLLSRLKITYNSFYCFPSILFSIFLYIFLMKDLRFSIWLIPLDFKAYFAILVFMKHFWQDGLQSALQNVKERCHAWR